MAIQKISPGGDLMFLQDRMNRVFEESLKDSGLNRSPGQFVPHVDIYEDDACLTIKVELPGVRREEVSLDISDGVLTISGNEDAAESFHVIERQYGRFKRSFNLPEGFDLNHVRANFHAGVLEVVLPKAVRAKARKIPIIQEGE
jgi:HSP20 family protein